MHDERVMEILKASTSPMQLAYTVWFRNLLMEPDDQDYEWVAIFLVEADTAEAARSWGDHLAKSYSSRNLEEALFLWSDVRTLDDPIWSGVTRPWSESSLVRYGHEATDKDIGW